MRSKLVTQLTPDGYYVGQTVADESPLEPGVWLIPAGAVDIAPPLIQDGTIAKFLNGEWHFEVIPTVNDTDPELESPPTPSYCSRRQARLALLHAGYLENVEQFIANIEDPIRRRAAEIEYESDLWERNNSFLQATWQALGGTQEDLDSLFSLAVTL